MAWKSTKLSFGVIGKLGAATAQAACQSKRPISWLKTRLRRELMPNEPRRDYYCPVGFRADLLRNRTNVLRRLALVIAGFNPGGMGQPVRADPIELARRLGYRDMIASEDKCVSLTLIAVLSRLVTEMVAAFLAAVPRPSQTRWHRIVKFFDRIQPRWLNIRQVPDAFMSQWSGRNDWDDCT